MGIVYHVSSNVSRVTLLEFLQYSVGKTASVGADSRMFLKVLSQNGLDVQNVVNEVLCKQVHGPNSIVRKGIIDGLCKEVVKTIGRDRKCDKLVIPYELNSVEQTKLCNTFSEFSLQFSTAAVGHPHAYSAASRICETQLVLKKLNYWMQKQPSVGKVVVVKDIGGNFVTHLERSRDNIHSCCPILDARDSMRFTTRLVKLREFKKGRFKCADDATFRKLVCDRVAQECPITADSVMFVHSSYDMSTVDMADAMDASQALDGMIVVMFDPNILVAAAGEVPHQNCIWRKYTENNVEKIKFSFRNDQSLDYHHVLSTYVKVCTGSVLVSTQGNVYFLEVVDNRNGCLYIRILKNMVPNLPYGKLTHFVWLDNREKVMVKYYDYGVHTCAGSVVQKIRFQYKPMQFLVSRRLYDFALTHLLGMNVNKFSIQSVYEYVRSLNSRVIVNGVDVVGGDKLSVEEFEAFSCALYCVAYRKRWMGNKLLSEITADEQDQRTKGDKNIVVRAFLKLKRKYQEIMTSHVADGGNEDGSLLNDMLLFAARFRVFCDYPAAFDLSIETAVETVPYEDIVPGLVDKYINQPEVSIRDMLREQKQVSLEEEEFDGKVRSVCEDMVDDWRVVSDESDPLVSREQPTVKDTNADGPVDSPELPVSRETPIAKDTNSGDSGYVVLRSSLSREKPTVKDTNNDDS